MTLLNNMTPEQLQRLETLERQMTEHRHFGSDSSQEISIINLVDVIPTVSAAPTTAPKRFRDQFVIYKNSTTYRFYWYDTVAAEWRYATGA